MPGKGEWFSLELCGEEKGQEWTYSCVGGGWGTARAPCGKLRRGVSGTDKSDTDNGTETRAQKH